MNITSSWSDMLITILDVLVILFVSLWEANQLWGRRHYTKRKIAIKYAISEIWSHYKITSGISYNKTRQVTRAFYHHCSLPYIVYSMRKLVEMCLATFLSRSRCEKNCFDCIIVKFWIFTVPPLGSVPNVEGWIVRIRSFDRIKGFRVSFLIRCSFPGFFIECLH